MVSETIALPTKSQTLPKLYLEIVGISDWSPESAEFYGMKTSL